MTRQIDGKSLQAFFLLGFGSVWGFVPPAAGVTTFNMDSKIMISNDVAKSKVRLTYISLY